jgi:hypothetical protein
MSSFVALEHFPAKWLAARVRMKKMRQNKNPERRFPIQSEREKL